MSAVCLGLAGLALGTSGCDRAVAASGTEPKPLWAAPRAETQAALPQPLAPTRWLGAHVVSEEALEGCEGTWTRNRKPVEGYRFLHCARYTGLPRGYPQPGNVVVALDEGRVIALKLGLKLERGAALERALARELTQRCSRRDEQIWRCQGHDLRRERVPGGLMLEWYLPDARRALKQADARDDAARGLTSPAPAPRP